MTGYSIKEAFTNNEEHYGFIQSFIKKIKKETKGKTKLDKMRNLQKRLAHMPVIIYDNCNYQGNRLILKVGNYNNLPNFNDRISSIRVLPTFKITIYEHNNFTGKSMTLTRSNSCLVNQNWNDIASSAKVEKLDVKVDDRVKTNNVNVGRGIQTVNVGKVSSKIGSDKSVKAPKIKKPIKINQKLGKDIKMPKKVFEDFTIETDHENVARNCFIIILILFIVAYYYFNLEK